MTCLRSICSWSRNALLIVLLSGSEVNAGHAQEVRTIVAGATNAVSMRLPVIAGDTIDRYFEQAGQLVPAGVFFVDSRQITNTETGSVYVVANEFHAPNGSVSYDTIAMSATDLRPLWHRVHAASDSASVRYDHSDVSGWVTAARQPTKAISTTLEPLPFLSYRFVLGMLPLAEGYAARVRVYNMWTQEQIWIRLEVIRTEEVSVSGRQVPAWVVDVRLNEAQDPRMFWIEVESGREIKQAQTYPDGRKVWQIRR